jgi:hypothetical protein
MSARISGMTWSRAERRREAAGRAPGVLLEGLHEAIGERGRVLTGLAAALMILSSTSV